MLASQQLDVAVRVATVVAPIAVYFLIIGLLNSRRRPQIMSGRIDFTLMIVALCPLVLVPVLHAIGVSALSVSLAIATVAGGIALLAPKAGTWVIYNISTSQATRAVRQALDNSEQQWAMEGNTFVTDDGKTRLSISSFPMLRNVSVRLTGDGELSANFGRDLSAVLAPMSADTEPAAAAILLVATVMLLAPLAFLANQAGEIVRILTDLLR